MKDSERKNKPDNHVSLTVITVEGNYTDDYNIHNPLQKVVDKTIEKLNLLYDPAQYALYINGSTDPLDLSTTIEQAGLNDGAVLEYRRKSAGGGKHYCF